MIPLTIANYRVLVAFLLVVFSFSAGWKVNEWRFTAKIETMQSDHAKALAKAVQEARTKEQAIQIAADKLRKEKDENISKLNNRLNAALNELRYRPYRSASATLPKTPVTGSSTEGCTGRELYRQDAEFLIREATRADKLRESLFQCQAQYNQVRDTIGK